MYHVHLNYSPAGKMRNALSLGFIGFSDTVAPRLLSVQLTDEQGNNLGVKKSPAKIKASTKVSTSVSTTVSTVQIPAQLENLRLLVEAYDQNQGNVARRRLGLYKVGYQLLSQDGQLLPGHEQPTWNMVFDQLPPDDESVKVAYAKESGITVHGSAETRFVYEVNNQVSQGRAQAGWLRRADLLKAATQANNTNSANPSLMLRVIVQDFSGNSTQKDVQLAF
jgi:methionine-rich copper-binding protein CopC